MTWEPPTGADVQMFFEKVLRGENAGTPRRHSPRGEKERSRGGGEAREAGAAGGDGRREGGGTREARQAPDGGAGGAQGSARVRAPV